jgi:hypothetical protein
LRPLAASTAWRAPPLGYEATNLYSTIAIVVAGLVAVGILLAPRVRRSSTWSATVTPLASIIGSGFLVLGPLLVREYGTLAPVVMLVLCALAYGFGSALRYNIRYAESLADADAPSGFQTLEMLSRAVLAGAYVVSVCYYLNLLGSFAVSLTAWDTTTNARIVSSVVLGVIGVVSVAGGLKRLESAEALAVTIKLAIVTSFLVGMGIYAGTLWTSDGIPSNPVPPMGWHGLFLVFGLVICVQGFETSRYLGEEYDADTRIRTMKLAQWVATIIYVVYVVLLTLAFEGVSLETDETAIIHLSQVMNPMLPVMLVVAAFAAQFSAAVADTVGCGGLVVEISSRRVHATAGYMAVVAGGFLLTWTADVFEIIAYASRAFAVYYAAQAAIATLLAAQRRSAKAFFFGAMALLGVAMALFGIPAE